MHIHYLPEKIMSGILSIKYNQNSINGFTFNEGVTGVPIPKSRKFTTRIPRFRKFPFKIHGISGSIGLIQTKPSPEISKVNMQNPEIPILNSPNPEFQRQFNPEIPFFSGAIPKIPSRKWPNTVTPSLISWFEFRFVEF